MWDSQPLQSRIQKFHEFRLRTLKTINVRDLPGSSVCSNEPLDPSMAGGESIILNPRWGVPFRFQELDIERYHCPRLTKVVTVFTLNPNSDCIAIDAMSRALSPPWSACEMWYTIITENISYHRVSKKMDSSLRISGNDLCDQWLWPFLDAAKGRNMWCKVLYTHFGEYFFHNFPGPGHRGHVTKAVD